MTLNALFIKTPTPSWVDLADDMAERFGWAPKLWVGAGNGAGLLETRSLNKADFYEQKNALLAIPPQLPSTFQWQSVDAEILEDLSRHEPIFQEMINRWTIEPEKASYKSRIQYYNMMIEIWWNIFIYYDLDLVIMPSPPHRVFDYACYLVADYIGIPTLMTDASAAVYISEGTPSHRSFVISRITNRTDFIYKEFLDKNSDIVISDSVKEYISRSLHDYKNAKPGYLEKQRNSDDVFSIKTLLPFSLKIYIKYIIGKIFVEKNEYVSKLYFPSYWEGETIVRNPTQLEADRYHQSVIKRTARAKRWLTKNASRFDDDCNYVLFAASRQPERSTCPDAGYFYDHTDVLRLLSQNIPDDWVIYYKEHPSNFRRPWSVDMQRSREFYKKIRQIAPKVSFLPIEVDPFAAIDGARFVSTTTGTIGWEALLRGKSAVIFGSNWYENLPGVYVVQSRNDLIAALKKIGCSTPVSQKFLAKYAQFVTSLGIDPEWRHRENFGCREANWDDPVYTSRVRRVADAYFGGHKRFLKQNDCNSR